jgi:hypothetical protein
MGAVVTAAAEGLSAGSACHSDIHRYSHQRTKFSNGELRMESQASGE